MVSTWVSSPISHEIPSRQHATLTMTELMNQFKNIQVFYVLTSNLSERKMKIRTAGKGKGKKYSKQEYSCHGRENCACVGAMIRLFGARNMHVTA